MRKIINLNDYSADVELTFKLLFNLNTVSSLIIIETIEEED